MAITSIKPIPEKVDKGKQDLKKTIEENPVAISTASKDGKPNIAVAAYVKIKDGRIVITDNYMKKTIENIKENRKISLAVWNKEWKGWKIEGEADYFTEGDWMDFCKAIPENKNEACRGALVVTPLDTREIG